MSAVTELTSATSSAEEDAKNTPTDETEVGVKLKEVIDSVLENIHKPIESKLDMVQNDPELITNVAISDREDNLNATVSGITIVENDTKGLAYMQQCCDKTSELKKLLEQKEMLSVRKELFDSLHLQSKPSTSVLKTSEGNHENEEFHPRRFDHGYSLKESHSNKTVTTASDNIKLQDVSAALIMSNKRQPKKRKEVWTASNENISNSNINEDNSAKRKRFPQFLHKPNTLSAKCLEPFQRGWRRELVRRKANSDKITSDVYYFSATGIKLRSYREVAEYLKEINEKNLSLDCFTYKKVLIYHPPEENERNAGESVGRTPNFKSKSPVRVKNNSPSSSASKVPAKFSKKTKFSPSSKIIKMSKDKTKNKIKIKNIKKPVKHASVPCSLMCAGQHGIVPSLQCEVCLCMFHPPCVNVASDQVNFICIKCNYRRLYRNGEEKRNFAQTPKTPDQSDVDINPDDLESPVTLEVRTSMITNNISVKKVQVPHSYHVLPRLTAAPTALKSVLNSNNGIGKNCPNPPPLKLSPFALKQPITQIKSDSTWVPPQELPPKTIPYKQPPPLKMITLNTNKQTNGSSVITRPPPPLIQQRAIVPSVSPQTRLVMVPISVPSMNSILQQNIPNAAENVVATSPVPLNLTPPAPTPVLTQITGVPSLAKPSQKPGVVTMVNNMMINNVMVNNVGTMKFSIKTNNGNVTEVLVPEIKPTNAVAPPQPKYIVTDKFGKPNGLVVGYGTTVIQLPILNKLESYQRETSGGIISVPLPSASTSILMPKLVTSEAPSKKPDTEDLNKEAACVEKTTDCNSSELSVPESSNLSEKSNKVEKQDGRATDPMISKIRRCFAGATTLLRIFEHLTHDDLSRARCVCKAWNWWASQEDLWKSIDLSGTCVHDWNKFAGVIKQYKSTRLDLRKMSVYEDQNRTWHCFISVLKDLETIEHLDLGYIPGAFLTPIARGLNRLKVLTAEMIVEYSNNNCRLDMGIFGTLHHLTKLRLRGISGLQLQNITTEGLSSLANLSNLVHLSITTIRDAPASDFEVIKSLKQLKELELGDCKNWETNTYGYLFELTELEKLRLDVGIAFPHDFCYSSMLKLNKLKYLELNEFQINGVLISVLKHLPQLEHFTVLPNSEQNSEITNTIIFDGVQTLKNLKVFDWKLLTATVPQKPIIKKENNCENDSEDETTFFGPDVDKCDDENSRGGIKENAACIPIVLNGKSNCISISELSVKMTDVCSNVIFH